MASGGGSRSEPRKRVITSSRYRTDSEDLSSLGSARFDDRPNNWDFSDWTPASTLDTGKRIKKDNPEKQKEKEWERELERVRERAHHGESPAPAERTRHHTPSTFPRTKMSSGMPQAQRVALENLRQHITFSDGEEMSGDAERNNERYQRRDMAAIYPLPEASDRNNMGNARRDRAHLNRNVSPEEPDSNQIVARLMQIRDYIKQASKSADPGDKIRASQLQLVVARLKDQEQKYLDLLLKLSNSEWQHSKMSDLVVHLKQQESRYLHSLLALLSAREEELLQQNASAADSGLSESEVASLELDDQSVHSEATDNTTDAELTQRPKIEDRLGRHSDTELEDLASARSSRSTELDSTLVQEQASTAAELQKHRHRLQDDLMKKNDELEALREQHDLLKKMLYQQEQLRALQGRQTALQALQSEAERNLEEERANNAGAASNEETSDSQYEEPPDTSEVQEAMDNIPTELHDLRRRLNYLKNIYDIPEQGDSASASQLSALAGSEVSLMSMERHQLESKLSDLQSKKSQMDALLQDLQALRDFRLPSNDMEVDSTSSSQQQLSSSLTQSVLANRTAAEAQDMLDLLESRKKLQKLQEVKDRLNQLRDLVQYYQSGTEFIHGEDVDLLSSVVAMPNNRPEAPAPRSNLRREAKGKARAAVANKFQQYGEGILTSGSESQNASEVASSTHDESDNESDLSGLLGAAGENPTVANKVSKLKAAKEKLHRLQELVAMVQQSPDLMSALPEDLVELAAGLEDSPSLTGSSQKTSPNTVLSMGHQSSNDPGSARGRPASLSQSSERSQNGREGSNAEAADMDDVDYAANPRREEMYQAKMFEQREELEQLMAERQRLVSIQDQLQHLYQQLPVTERPMSEELPASSSEAEEAAAAQRKSTQTRREVKPTTEVNQVTFQEPLESVASYDELYGRMRQQRMLREELRDKKKELENMMRKDRPRKQYFRNQDNQSDNVSFSNKSDPYSYVPTTTSGEVTMATWGGSTADNLESIEEDENDSGAGQDAEDEEDVDDGYPSDGIVQVEEEEEADAESDDRETYTIEDEYHARARQPIQPPVIESKPRPRRRRAKAAAARRKRQQEYSYWNSDPSVPPSRRKVAWVHRQENVCPAEELIEEVGDGHLLLMQNDLRAMHQQLSDTQAQLAQLQQQTSGLAAMSPNSPAVVTPQSFPAQLQQQQLLLNLNSCYQQMLFQQQESTERLRRVEHHLLSTSSATDMMDGPQWEPHLRLNSLGPLPYSPAAQSPHGPAGRTPFMFQPQPFNAPGYGYNNSNAGGMPGSSGEETQQGYVDHRESQAPGYSERRESRLSEYTDRRESQAMSEATFNHHIQALYKSNLPSASPNSRVPHPTPPEPWSQEALSQQIAELYGSDAQLVSSSETQDDSVHIQTIQASDQRVPRLELNALLRHRQQLRSKLESGSISSQSVNSKNEAVIGRKFVTPSRAKAASQLASRQHPGAVGGAAEARPGLSSGISGTAYETGSVSSYASSLPGGSGPVHKEILTQHVPKPAPQPAQHRPSDVTEFSVFEALRDTIYSEVATLISQNENRPHFLIELFRQMQLLTNDYLRQRALYAIQELVTRQLTTDDELSERNAMAKGRTRKLRPSVVAPKLTEVVRRDQGFEAKNKSKLMSQSSWLPSASQLSELTPSESLVTSDDEIIKVLNSRRPLHTSPNPQSDTSAGPAQRGSIKCGQFDYVEPVETASSLSTPNSSCVDTPFAKESLGDTVIHLDKALQKMREYEQRLVEMDAKDSDASPPSTRKPAQAAAQPSPQLSQNQDTDSVASSSAQDQGSGSESSDFPQYPRIDTQQLDRQIKAIMTEIIPVLKEHMADGCSQQLLQYIRRLVLSLTRQKDNSHEFVRFFHKQLGSILQDSLTKFEGRKMRECGEDLLVELSEILFNELAFFRLMQDLDDPKARVKDSIRKWRQDSQTSTETGDDMKDENNSMAGEETSDVSETEGDESGDADDNGKDESDEEKDINEAVTETETEDDDDDENDGDENETEDLGKARDDELASRVDINDGDEDSETPGKPAVKILLAPSETKPYTRIGSDEDDEGEDEAQSAEDPADTAVSRDGVGSAALLSPHLNHLTVLNRSPSPSQEYEDDFEDDTSRASQDAEEVTDEVIFGDTSSVSESEEEDPVNHTVLHQPPAVNGTASPPQGAGDALHVNGEVDENEIEVTLDDLPPKLDGLTKEQETSLEAQAESEEQQNSGMQAILKSMEVPSELAGDPTAIKQPGS